MPSKDALKRPHSWKCPKCGLTLEVCERAEPDRGEVDEGILFGAIISVLDKLGVLTFGQFVPRGSKKSVVDIYLCGWMLFEAASLAFAQLSDSRAHPKITTIVLLLLATRTVEICRFLLLLLFRGWVHAPYRWVSTGRSLCFAMLGYLELLVVFACAHFLFSKWLPSYLDNGKQFANVGDALYFSAVTLSTLGFGDIAPQHAAAKGLVTAQVLVGPLIILSTVARFIGSMVSPPVKSHQAGSRERPAKESLDYAPSLQTSIRLSSDVRPH